jgi:hypothetical protein
LPKGSAIEKKLGVKSALNFTLKVDSDRDLVQIKNLSLTAKEDKAKVAAEITANFDINTLSGTLEKLRLQNKNFGKNDFSISFDEDKKSKISELNIKGLKFDLGSLVANKFFDNFSKSDNSSALKVRINLPTVYLLNGKILKQFSLALNYGDGIFNYGLMKANYFGKNFIDLKINKNKKEDF